jgi:NADPH:quinone reductase-like Zn-dependent oxidoreductase
VGCREAGHKTTIREPSVMVNGMRVFVAGATGAVGFEFVRLAKAKGCFLNTLSRSPENARKLADLADQVEVQDVCTSGMPSLKGIEVVVSSLGAPVTLNSPEKRPYREIDLVS